MHHHCVTLAYKGEQPIERGPLGIFARGLVGEDPIDRDTLKLALGVLVKATNLNVANPFTAHRLLLANLSG